MPLNGSAKEKMKQAMHEYAEGRMHSGKKSGPVVKNKRQAIAIALSESGLSKKKKKKK